MKTKENKISKKNKSSIVRVIISNFDDKQVKEIKVLYNKQGGVDVIRLNGTEEAIDGKMKFDFNIAYNRREDVKTTSLELNDDENFTIQMSEDKTELYVTKWSDTTKDIIRRYILSGRYENTKSNDKKVIVTVRDKRDYTGKESILNKRSLEQSTNRILLSEDAINNYRQIVCSDMGSVDEEIVIDSKEIYKINKYLSYRSNMIIYYQIINNFFMNGYRQYIENEDNKIDYKPKINEVWQYEKATNKEKKTFIASIAEYIHDARSRYIETHNEMVKNKYVKNNLDKDAGTDTKINIGEDTLKEDLEKILLLFSRFRHTLLHYNYIFYGKLFSGSDFNTSNKDGEDIKALSELLDLGIFKELGKIKLVKSEIRTNYLDKSSKIYVLGQDVKAIELLKIYNDLCNSKNGFNKFINEMISESGEENEKVKDIITKSFKDGYSSIERAIEKTKREKNYDQDRKKQRKVNALKQRLEEQEKLLSWFDAPYVYDIHSSREYKDLYIMKKNLVEDYTKSIVGDGNCRDKNVRAKLNESLSYVNKKMKEITLLNSKYRLQYKMQLAFGFLNEKYNLDINRFKDKFNLEEKTEYKKDISRYIFSKVKRSELSLGNFIKDYKFEDVNDLFSSTKDNNLVKLYILIYLFLPIEIRGDFLGFVKKNYYDMKHVDFIERNDKDTFFHDLRLFERNSRDLEILKYNFIDGFMSEEVKTEFIKKLNKAINKKSNELVSVIDLKDYNKALILPIMKYYQIISKLLNDIEIISLFEVGNGSKDKDNAKNNILKIGIDNIKDKNNVINFAYLMKKVTGKGNIDDLYQIRNNIAHINMEPLYLCEFTRYLINNNDENKCVICNDRKKDICVRDDKSISQSINKIIELCKEKNLLGRDFDFGDNKYLS